MLCLNRLGPLAVLLPPLSDADQSFSVNLVAMALNDSAPNFWPNPGAPLRPLTYMTFVIPLDCLHGSSH